MDDMKRRDLARELIGEIRLCERKQELDRFKLEQAGSPARAGEIKRMAVEQCRKSVADFTTHTFCEIVHRDEIGASPQVGVRMAAMTPISYERLMGLLKEIGECE